MKDKMVRFILRRIAPRLIQLLGKSIRFEWENEEWVKRRASRGESVIFCFWHNRFLMMPFLYGRVRGEKNICVMASRSRDGRMITDVLEGFRFAVARGSSSRGGETAVREMAGRVRAGMDAAVTPDGPRGPLYRVQPGVVFLSQLSGAPIVPVTYDAHWRIRLKSWDRFIIPLPFSRGAVVFGDPLFVQAGAGEAGRAESRAKLEDFMRALDRRAAEMVGVSPD